MGACKHKRSQKLNKAEIQVILNKDFEISNLCIVLINTMAFCGGKWKCVFLSVSHGVSLFNFNNFGKTNQNQNFIGSQ